MAVCFNYFLSTAIFLNIDISQGSVAIRLRCGGIFKYELVAKLPVSLPVKEFWKSVNSLGSYGQEFGVLFFFWDSVYEITVWIFTWIFKNNFLPFAAPSKCRLVRPAPPRTLLATPLRRAITSIIHNTSVVGLFMTPIGQWKWLERVTVECTCLLHIGPM